MQCQGVLGFSSLEICVSFFVFFFLSSCIYLQQTVVCLGSAGSMWHCVAHCVAACDTVWHCVAACGTVWQEERTRNYEDNKQINSHPTPPRTILGYTWVYSGIHLNRWTTTLLLAHSLHCQPTHHSVNSSSLLFVCIAVCCFLCLCVCVFVCLCVCVLVYLCVFVFVLFMGLQCAVRR